jgi:hypothetical protein
MANLSDDPEFAAATSALGRLLNGPSPQEVTAQLRLVMSHATEIDHAARPVIIGLLNVMAAVHTWVALATSDPNATIPAGAAASQILNAIERGLDGETL